jgi:hypothetical protein
MYVAQGQSFYFTQEIYKKPQPKKKRNFERDGRGGHNNHDRGNNKRKMQPRDHSDQPKKKPLLKTPMEERPICRFYKEGKCQKVKSCYIVIYLKIKWGI